MKNLVFLLKLLKRVRFAVSLDIYGSINDHAYWGECVSIIQGLPADIKVSYCSVISHQNVAHVLSQYDIFVLPTLGENYGHAIAESLAQGTPVLISDRTPWRDLQAYGAGWDLSLDEPDRFLEIFEFVHSMDKYQYLSLRMSTAAYAQMKLNDPKILKANRDLMLSALCCTMSK